MKANTRPSPRAAPVCVRLALCFCILVFSAPGPGNQETGDFDAEWCRYLVHGLEPAGAAGRLFLQNLTARFGDAGPAVSRGFRDASAIISFLVRARAVAWPDGPAGRDLDHYLLEEPAPDDSVHLLQSMAGRVETALQQIHVQSGARQPEVSACATDLGALALMARYHADKATAAGSLTLFEQSGDVTALRRAASGATTAADVWERLAALVARTPGLLFGADVAVDVGQALRIARDDLALIGQVDEAFRHYGLFDVALAFGPERDDAHESVAGRWPQGRFRLLSPAVFYTRDRGFGWIRVQSVRPSGATGLRGTGDAVLAIDLADGQYVVTSLVANQPELASGSFQIRAGPDAIGYAPGETGAKSMHARATGGRMEIGFVPGSGNDWLVCALVITRRAPHFGYIPPRVVQSELAVTPTITAPDGIAEASFSCITPEGKPMSLPFVRDGAEFALHLQFAERWRGKPLLCHLAAVDQRGTAARFPASGDFTVHVR